MTDTKTSKWDELETVEIANLKFKVRPGIWDKAIVSEVISGNPYASLLINLPANGIIIDVGGHIGSFTVLAASKGAQVLAIEPFPDNFALLVENVRLNQLEHKVKAFNMATWSDGEEHEYYLPQVNTGGTGLLGGDTPDAASIPVSCIRLDELMRQESIQSCHGLKMDCEGGEYAILGSLSPDTLRRFNVISLEYHDPHKGRRLEKLIQQLQQADFSIANFPMEEGELLGILHAFRDDFLDSLIRKLRDNQFTPITIKLIDSPYTRLPMLGAIWKLVQRGAHQLVVYYINQLVDEQRKNNEVIYWALQGLKARSTRHESRSPSPNISNVTANKKELTQLTKEIKVGNLGDDR